MVRHLVGLALGGVLLACNQVEELQPPAVELHFPTDLVGDRAGHWLYVANGDLDASRGRSSVVAVDLVALRQAIAGASDGCALPLADAPLACDLRRFAQPVATALPGGVASLLLDEAPPGMRGVERLLAVSRQVPALSWMEVRDAPGRLWCSQNETGACTGVHVVPMAAEPAHLVGDRGGFRYAYVPHLLEQRLSLVRLDGDFGPEVVDVVEEFFDLDPFFRTKLGGGFSVAQLPCHADPPYVPTSTSQCRRPSLYASQRYALGMRTFTVSPGRAAVLAGVKLPLIGVDPLSGDPPDVPARPLMGDLAVVETSDKPLMVGVQVTPAVLFTVDLTLDDAGEPLHRVIGSVPLCDNPNRLVVHDLDRERPLALVTCASDGRLAAVDLGSLLTLRTVQLGDGANAMWLDKSAQWLWIANARAHTLSVVDIDRTRPSFLRQIAVLSSPK